MDKEKTFYVNNNYITKDRWNNYWYQIKGVRMFGEALNVLEIGPGGKIVSGLLSKLGFSVKTLDINKNIEPDYVASADNLPMADKSFDVVLAAEILEHLPFDKFGKALSEIKRVSKIGAVVSLPQLTFEPFTSTKTSLLFAQKKTKSASGRSGRLLPHQQRNNLSEKRSRVIRISCQRIKTKNIFRVELLYRSRFQRF